VTAIYLISEFGSDPMVVDLLGLKASQSHNIIDPLQATSEQHSDESRMKLLAKNYLNKIGVPLPEVKTDFKPTLFTE